MKNTHTIEARIERFQALVDEIAASRRVPLSRRIVRGARARGARVLRSIASATRWQWLGRVAGSVDLGMIETHYHYARKG